MWPEQSGASRVVAFMGTHLCPGGSGALLAASLRGGGGEGAGGEAVGLRSPGTALECLGTCHLAPSAL